MGGRDHRRCSADHPRARAPRRGSAHDHQLRLVAAARASRGAALLGGGRALGDAGGHRITRRRVCLRLRLDQRHRRAARRGGGTGDAAAAQPGARHDSGRADCRHAAQSRRELRLQWAPLHVSRHSPHLLGRRQSLPSPPGSQSAAPRLAEAANRHRARQLVDGNRASRRYRASRHHLSRAQRHWRLLPRHVHSRDAPRHRSDWRCEERF